MDFAMLPPETNSAQMYTGPGSGPLLAAAAAWDELAAELSSAANSYQAVVSGLTAGHWLGPASASMAAAATTYAAWLNTTAAQAAQTASQAKAAVASYQEAFASTVPPSAVAANRSLLTRLVANNLFGRYTAAIAVAEAQYAEMWAQDAAAMYGYAGSSASATALTPFASPQQNTDPTASANQAAAVGEATGTSAGNVQSTVLSVQHVLSAVPNALQSLAAAAPAQATDPLSTLSSLISVFFDLPADLATFFIDIPFGAIGVSALPLDIIGAGTGLHTDDIVSGWAGVEAWPGTGVAPPTEFKGIITGPIAPTATVPSPSAGLGQANTVGALSVPPTWTIATPAVRAVAVTLPALPESGIGAIPVAAAADTAEASTLGDMALAGMAGRALAGTVRTGGGKDGGKAAAGKRVTTRPASTGTTGTTGTSVPAAADADGVAKQSKPRTVVTGVAAELREFAKLRDDGILTDEEYTEQKNRLLGR
jgi:PPE-repeat protein